MEVQWVGICGFGGCRKSTLHLERSTARDPRYFHVMRVAYCILFEIFGWIIEEREGELHLKDCNNNARYVEQNYPKSPGGCDISALIRHLFHSPRLTSDGKEIRLFTCLDHNSGLRFKRPTLQWCYNERLVVQQDPALGRTNPGLRHLEIG